jgi:hypothetical protein
VLKENKEIDENLKGLKKNGVGHSSKSKIDAFD